VDNSWKNWVKENLDRGCDPMEMCGILQKNKFTLPQIKQAMGASFPVGFGQTEATAPAVAGQMQGNDAGPLALKSASLLEIQRDLHRLSPKSRTIERRSGVSGDEFLEKYYAANRPVILCDLMAYWQAPQKWTPEYLKATCGDEVVEIMAARETNPEYEIDDAQHRKQIKFSAFVDMVMVGRETNDYYLTARNEFFTRPGVKPLLRDIEIFTEYLKETSGEGVFLWFGPKGTITPLHHDMMNIFMSQVQGRKRIRMIPADEIEFVYNHFAVYSQVDINKPDYEKFPKFRHANIMEFELAPGEVLFIPVGWWHSVTSLDQSITVSFNNFLFPNDYKWHNPAGDKKTSLGY
jgi:ribosomal protein L16 Arg81 hydroxylase